MGRLTGKAVLIAGGTGGIGSVTAHRFAREGARVAIGSPLTADGETLVHDIIAAGGDAVFMTMDVRDEGSVDKAVALTVEQFGRLDILINNAGGSSNSDGPVTTASLDEFWNKMQVDLFGTFVSCRFAIPHLIAAGGGSIINMTSMAGFGGTVGRDAYTSAKGGVMALTKAMARTLVTERVRVNAIAPGVVGTERIRAMLEAADSSLAHAVLGRQPMGLIDPAEIAALATFLASDESLSLTGQIIAVHGGMFE
jgi:NAD(P)-dependent dehydrogenase (short-subunit alcohol dehydrogenase family)